MKISPTQLLPILILALFCFACGYKPLSASAGPLSGLRAKIKDHTPHPFHHSEQANSTSSNCGCNSPECTGQPGCACDSANCTCNGPTAVMKQDAVTKTKTRDRTVLVPRRRTAVAEQPAASGKTAKKDEAPKVPAEAASK